MYNNMKLLELLGRAHKNISYWFIIGLLKIKSRFNKILRLIKPKITIERLIKDLTNAGIKRGDILMIHSSLSSIGNVEGGAQAVIRSLIEVVGEEGTLMMPSFGSADETIKKYYNNELIDLRREKSQTGKISEFFRLFPNVKRSSHPFTSVCAWGKYADYMLKDHSIDPKMWHESSPFYRLKELNGKIIGIGTSLGPVSFYHVIEDTWSEFPFEVNSPKFKLEYIDNEGEIIERELYRHDPVISRTRIDHKDGEWIKHEITKYFKNKGILKFFKFGKANSWQMDSSKLYDELIFLARNGITIYLTKEEWVKNHTSSISDFLLDKNN